MSMRQYDSPADVSVGEWEDLNRMFGRSRLYTAIEVLRRNQNQGATTACLFVESERPGGRNNVNFALTRARMSLRLEPLGPRKYNELIGDRPLCFVRLE